jgi:cell division protein FtsA
MLRNISVGIDVGTETTRVVVAEFQKGEKHPKVIGVGTASSKGLRHGYVINSAEVSDSIRRAVREAEKSAGIKIKRAFLALSGTTLRGVSSLGSTIVSKADGEVTNLDVNKALEDAEDNLSLGNKKIIHVYPTLFKLDGKEVLGRVEGLRGTKLEVKAIFIIYSLPHLEDLLGAVADAGIEVLDIVASPIASSNIVLTEKQRIVGVALVDIGDEKTSITIFENGLLVSMYTFSLGSTDITNDIALGFKTTLEKANGLKIGTISGEFPEKKLVEIMEARLWDIFESIDNYLKKIKRSELLPAGVVFIGGGAKTSGLEELSREVLKLPSSVGTTDMFDNSKTKLRDPSWFNALGLLLKSRGGETYSDAPLVNIFTDLKNAIKAGLKQLMP